MGPNKASWTAEVSVIFRATESIRPEEDRVCHDPYARFFIRPAYRILLKNRTIALSIVWFAIERRFPGATGIHVARVRFIDDRMAECLDNGFNQVVILGAGYDTRAYRFDGLNNTKVFELDHPATQKVKKEKVLGLLGALPVMKARGFSHVRNHSHEWLKRTYFKGRNQYRRLCPCWGIVDATV